MNIFWSLLSVSLIVLKIIGYVTLSWWGVIGIILAPIILVLGLIIVACILKFKYGD